MKTFRLLPCIALLALLAFSFASCKKDNEKSRLTVYLTDAPADYDAIDIEIMGLEVKAGTDPGETGWKAMTLASTPVSYNLLEFTNGMEALLSSVELPSGKISQLRLILGDGNTITVNGSTTTLPLEVPSGQESGLKFNIHADLIAGIEYKLWIDFDASRSVVEDGTGGYKLKPVIRTFTEATSGAIKGIAMPLEAGATVEATNGVDTLGAIPDPVSGEFLIRGVAAGTWTVKVIGNNGYQDHSTSNVTVVTGEVTDIGTVTLNL